MYITGTDNTTVQALKDYCIINDIDYEIPETIEAWSGSRKFLEIFSVNDWLQIKLVFGDKCEKVSSRDVMPDDNDEVKVHCRDCNGYVFSISGYEFIRQREYQYYRCVKQVGGKCQYE